MFLNDQMYKWSPVHVKKCKKNCNNIPVLWARIASMTRTKFKQSYSLVREHWTGEVSADEWVPV